MPRRGPKRAGSRPPRRQGLEGPKSASKPSGAPPLHTVGRAVGGTVGRGGGTEERERAVAEAEEREVGVDLRPRAALVEPLCWWSH